MTLSCAHCGPLEDALSKRLVQAQLLTEDGAPRGGLVRACRDARNAFTSERARLCARYFDSGLRLDAYLAAFMLPNVAKIEYVLRRHVDLLPSSGPIDILDIGCGPGTGVFAVSHICEDLRPKQPLRIVAVEEQRPALAAARELCSSLLPRNHRVDFVSANALALDRAATGRRFHLAIAANVFNELADDDARFRLAQSALSTGAALVIIDPALRTTARALMRLRNTMIDDGVCVIAPCTHKNACPMLDANERDWCHFFIDWKRPHLIESLDAAAGLNHRHLKMSYLVLRGAALCAPATGCAAYRVVSSPLRSKGKIELVLCGAGRLVRLRRLDRDASPTNEDFGSAMRGDLVVFTTKRPAVCRVADGFSIVERFGNPRHRVGVCPLTLS